MSPDKVYWACAHETKALEDMTREELIDAIHVLKQERASMNQTYKNMARLVRQSQSEQDRFASGFLVGLRYARQLTPEDVRKWIAASEVFK